MKLWMWIALAVAAAGAMLLVTPAKPTVTVIADGVTMTSRGSATVVVGEMLTSVDSVSTTVPVTGTSVPNSGTKLPAWLGSPLAMGVLYSAAAVGTVFLLQALKRRFGWEGKQMLKMTLLVVAAVGSILAYLFKDSGIGILSNVWVLLGGGGSILYTLGNLLYQWKFRT